MKPCRFIFNSDYATPKNKGEFTISVFIPDTIFIPQNTYKKFSADYTVPVSKAEGYRCYVESTAFPYAVTGCYFGEIKYNDQLNLSFVLSRTETGYKFAIYTPKPSRDTTINGTAQTVTAHIQTFVPDLNP